MARPTGIPTATACIVKDGEPGPKVALGLLNGRRDSGCWGTALPRTLIPDFLGRTLLAAVPWCAKRNGFHVGGISEFLIPPCLGHHRLELVGRTEQVRFVEVFDVGGPPRTAAPLVWPLPDEQDRLPVFRGFCLYCSSRLSNVIAYLDLLSGKHVAVMFFGNLCVHLVCWLTTRGVLDTPCIREIGRGVANCELLAARCAVASARNGFTGGRHSVADRAITVVVEGLPLWAGIPTRATSAGVRYCANTVTWRLVRSRKRSSTLRSSSLSCTT